MSIKFIRSGEARTRWRDLLDVASVGEVEIVIERHGKPIASLINYEQYLQIETILEELRAIQQADKMVQKWLEEPTIGRPYSEIRKILVEEGILDQ